MELPDSKNSISEKDATQEPTQNAFQQNPLSLIDDWNIQFSYCKGVAGGGPASARLTEVIKIKIIMALNVVSLWSSVMMEFRKINNEVKMASSFFKFEKNLFVLIVLRARNSLNNYVLNIIIITITIFYYFYHYHGW